jgi:hypothetical protein
MNKQRQINKWKRKAKKRQAKAQRKRLGKRTIITLIALTLLVWGWAFFMVFIKPQFDLTFAHLEAMERCGYWEYCLGAVNDLREYNPDLLLECYTSGDWTACDV